MADLVVRYNGNVIAPTPLVRYSKQFIDYGARWGDATQIELNGLITGLPVGGTGAIGTFTNIFTGQFGTLDVTETGKGSIYNWSNVVVQEINFPNSKFYEGCIAPYAIKMLAYNVPSGVVEPVNEYAFVQNDDGTVSLSHKISARGVPNISGSLNSAIGFVRSFSGRQNFASTFLPNNSGVLLSMSETIDRLTSTYSINETYKYNTGIDQIYLETFSLGITDAEDSEYLTIDANLKIQGSTITKNIGAVETALASVSIPSKISALGIATGFLAQTTFSVSRDTGAATIEIKSSYLSGYSTQDANGFFDYTVTIEEDKLLPKETWRVEGEFFCKGPLDFRTQQLNAFKSTNGSNWRSYLSGLLLASPLYLSGYHGSGQLSNFSQIEIHENTGQADFKISMTTVDGLNRTGPNEKYNVEVQPSRWNFELLPSANIEGHYVVQDPQVQTRSKIQIGATVDTLNATAILPALSGIVNDLSAIYVLSGFVTAESMSTGLLEAAYNKEWIGADAYGQNFLFTKVVGSTSFGFVRPPGFKFGY